MVKVNVRFYGFLKDVTNAPTAEVALNGGSSVADLLNHLAETYGQPFRDRVLDQAIGIKNHVKIFLDNEEVDSGSLETTRLSDGRSDAEAILYVMTAATGG